MKKPTFFSFSLAHRTRLERLAWGGLLLAVIGFNIFATQLNAQAAPTLAQPAEAEKVVVQSQFLPEIAARQPRRTFKVTLTSYTSLAQLTDASPFITANGSHVHMGTIAANCLAFGTQVQLPDLYGDQIFVVEDRLAARKGCGVIDVWLPSYDQAIQFGKQYSTVYVL